MWRGLPVCRVDTRVDASQTKVCATSAGELLNNRWHGLQPVKFENVETCASTSCRRYVRYRNNRPQTVLTPRSSARSSLIAQVTASDSIALRCECARKFFHIVQLLQRRHRKHEGSSFQPSNDLCNVGEFLRVLHVLFVFLLEDLVLCRLPLGSRTSRVYPERCAFRAGSRRAS